MHQRPRLIPALLTLLLAPVAAAADLPGGAAGDYAGWAYKPGADDFPLRLHLTQHSGAPALTIDLPAAKAGGLTTQNVALAGDALTCTRTSKSGKLWNIRATLRDRALEGSIKIGDDPPYDFTAARSDDPIVWIDPATLADLPGTYLGEGGRLITITAWPWGELRAMDTLTGANRTLLPIAQDKFIMGPANYIPAPRAATVSFARDGQRRPTLVWHDSAAAAPVTLVRDWLREEPIEIRATNATLRGALLKPPGPGPFPAVVVIGASDWQTRDDCRRDATLFASLGFAALITDLRGHGESQGESLASFDQLADDAAQAVKALRARSDIKPNLVGLTGRSRGGWIAPLAATKTPDAAFVIMFVPPAISPARQETTRRLNLFARDHTPAEQGQAAEYIELMWKAWNSDEDWANYAAARDRLAERGWLDTLDQFDSRDSEDFRWCVLNMEHDPIPALERLRAPFLAFFGERDENVVPAENMPLMEAALRHAGNADVTLRVVPKADHGLRIMGPSGPYRVHEFIGDAPETYAWLREWVRAHGVNPPEPAAAHAAH